LEDIDGSFSDSDGRGRAVMVILGLALVAVIMVAVIGGATLWADSQRWRQEAANQQAEAQKQHDRADKAVRQAGQLQGQVSSLQGQNQDLKGKAANPTLSIWNSCGGPCTVGPEQVRVGGVPDTFEFHVTFTATVPVALYFFTFHQWSQYDSCGFQVSCVSGPYDAYPSGTSRDVRFDKSTGCAGYVFVLAASQQGTITPNVEATYKPADHPTGECAQHA
jgi:cell division protein FtsB